MKTLSIVRHAKSSWDFPNLSDRDRPLNMRGNRDAPIMGKRFKEAMGTPELLISSPAVRAWDTAHIFAREIDFPMDEVVPELRLYHASVPEIIGVIAELGGNFDHLMIFGHNPGLTDLVNHFSPGLTDNLPTAGVVSLEFQIEQWDLSGNREGAVIHHDYPKKWKAD